MSRAIAALFSLCLLLSGCDQQPPAGDIGEDAAIRLNGRWILDSQGRSMQDPQTSGLIFVDGQLLTVSDSSAQRQQQHKLHRLQPQSATLLDPALSIELSRNVARGCFGQYLQDEPDYEGAVKDPDEAGVYYLVTEDASASGALSPRCERRYQETGSTDYPTLLVRLQQISANSVVLTDVRPIQFSQQDNVGNFPNDGIEGMTFGAERTLFLALERDATGQPRIFSLVMDSEFWSSNDFAKVTDSGLAVPQFASGSHPINGLAYYPGQGQHPGFVIAAARNDNQLWILDISAQRETKIVDLAFWAPADPSGEQCQPWEPIGKTSIEGIVVQGDTLWLINDPWKRHYRDNIQCELNKVHYQGYAPLLFNLPLQPQWFG